MTEPATISDEAMDGYLDGFKDERDEWPPNSNRSEAYKHGWLNGRDDRMNNPRDTAERIRADYLRLAEIEQRRARIQRRLDR